MQGRSVMPSLSRRLGHILLSLGLPLTLLLAAWLRFSRLGQFDNQYYTATVASMLTSWHNFLYASFDAGGVVSVDKPPVAFWLDSIPAALLGVSGFSASLMHGLAGLGSIALLYALIRPVYGRAAALLAALAMAVIPVAVAMDSRNEPDSIVSFQLLLAAFCVVRAVRSSRPWWLVAAAAVIGIGFNTKMWIALVPLPAFLAYYALVAGGSRRTRLAHITLALVVMVAISLSWVGLVAATPAERRPYVGSTPDNSIWTLVVEYNGLRRFTAFIGQRPGARPSLPSPPGGPPLPRGQLPVAPGPLPRGPLPPGAAPPSPLPAPSLGELFTPPFANQLGGLVTAVVLALLVAVAGRWLPPGVYRDPRRWLVLVRRPASGHLILWGGWLVVGLLVFGLAASTRTHPYYFSQLAPPAAAVLAIGLREGWQQFSHRGGLGWTLPVLLAAGGAYEVYVMRATVSGVAQAMVVVILLAVVAVLALGLLQRVTAAPLARAAAVAGCLVLLVTPLAASVEQRGPVVGRPPPQASLPATPPPAAAPLPGAPRPPSGPAGLVDPVIRYISARGDAGSVFTVGAMRAAEAAPFIIRGIPAVAIGGFSGGDPVFTPESLAQMAREGRLRHFLLSGAGGGPGPGQQGWVVESIRRTWQDVSLAAGLPPGMLYRYPGP